MSRPLRSLIAALLALLVAVNAAGAGALRGAATACCGGEAPAAAVAVAADAPCHEASVTLGCAHERADDAASRTAGGDACGGACAHCVAQAGSATACLVPERIAHAMPPAAWERPRFADPRAPAAPGQRLERPPCAAA